MSKNFALFVGQFGIQNPIISDSFKFSAPLTVTVTVTALSCPILCACVRQWLLLVSLSLLGLQENTSVSGI